MIHFYAMRKQLTQALLFLSFPLLTTLSIFSQTTFIVNGYTFEDRTIISQNFNDPIAMAFLPDGNLLTVQRMGSLSTVNVQSQTITPFMTVTNLYVEGEHGLINVVLDPQFTTNHYFYLYYTSGNKKNRISRFTDTGIPATRLASETLIWENPDEDNDPFHTGVHWILDRTACCTWLPVIISTPITHRTLPVSKAK